MPADPSAHSVGRASRPPRAPRPPRPPRAARDRSIALAVARWFGDHARDLPWRTTPRDPYLALVSEFMLQQTQVSRALEKFGPFISRFPTITDLAAADERDILALWSGLGYYRRARSLHAAAGEIVERFGARVPADAATLLTITGIGRYTAGAISSIVFARPEPTVDGNILRILTRLDARRLAPPLDLGWAQKRSAYLLRAAGSRPGPAALNEGLMELGATICSPRNPRCGECPLAHLCLAARRGIQHAIPRPAPSPPRRALYCTSLVVRDPRGRLLLEQRPSSGMWPGLWQAPTIEHDAAAPLPDTLLSRLALPALDEPPARAGSFPHQTTHRHVRFEVWSCRLPRCAPAPPGALWRSRSRLSGLGLSNPQRRILLGPAPPLHSPDILQEAP